MSKLIVKSRINLLGYCKGVVLGKQSLKIVFKSHIRRASYSDILGFCTIERNLYGCDLEITTDEEAMIVCGLSHLKTVSQFNTTNQTIKSFIEKKSQIPIANFQKRKSVVSESQSTNSCKKR